MPAQFSGEEIQSLLVTFRDLKKNILYGVDPADIAALANVILLTDRNPKGEIPINAHTSSIGSGA